MRRLIALLLVAVAATAHAHLGSPDTFVEAKAGPYKFLLAVHPPQTYPGSLEVDLRLNPGDGVTQVTAALDSATPLAVRVFDAGTATANLWVANAEAHTLRLNVQGNDYTVELPAGPRSALPANRGAQAVVLVAALLLLTLGGALLLGKRRSIGAALCVVAAVVIAVSVYRMMQDLLHKPVTMLQASVSDDGVLRFTLRNPAERFDDLVPDHGKLLHLFLVREPQKDVLLHLHPEQHGAGEFAVTLPSMPAGMYTLFADFYHRDARNETVVATLSLGQQSTHKLAGADDSFAVLSPLARPNLTPSAKLPDGYTMTLRPDGDVRASQARFFTATLLDPAGKAPADMALYLGTPAHAVVLREDNQVFAHIHPGGTLPMLMPATVDGAMPGMAMQAATNTTTIPYGFPSLGTYRVFVQMKHGSVIETGAFDFQAQ